ncbi:MAG: alpha-galactosidase [Oscillospiraceae bacterium]|nr:alpha-galactosidase [Oscillospiraceae bacterium]
MKTEISRYVSGDMLLIYEKDEKGMVGFTLIPKDTEHLLKDKKCDAAPLIELYVRGDCLPSDYGAGNTMCGSGSTFSLRFVRQYAEGDEIVTCFRDSEGKKEAEHHMIFCGDLRAAECWTAVRNTGEEGFTLEMISSGNIGGLTPYDGGEAPDTMEITTATSNWSAEGAMVTETVEQLSLETSWAIQGYRVKRIGQRGSLPVRNHFPFMAVHDRVRDVTWAVQLEAPASWQIEARRKDYGLAVTAGIADFDFGHWAKELKPGETFRTPSMYVTAVKGGAEKASQRLLDIQEKNRPKHLTLPPVMFNEYCTTWGEPSYGNLRGIVDALRGKGMEYLVIDAGWYKDEQNPWHQTGGDWVPSDILFPDGIKAAADMIREAGMVPGLWFESETCGSKSRMHDRWDMLHTRNGYVVDTGTRRFLDMRKKEVNDYLDEKVIGQLRDYGFGYIKNDYNESIGTGVDGAESLGEGLRQSVECSRDFFRRIREGVPGIVMENCASGGHRLEPSLMALFDMASFSDAHECVTIPVIAANLHRLILPMQSQIWAVIRKDDSLRRIHYSLVSTYLGAMCLSGDVTDLSDEQWEVIDRDIEFYRSVRHIIAHGDSRVVQMGVTSYSDLRGWQTVVRENEGEALVTVHTFGGEAPETIEVFIGDGRIADAVCSQGVEYSFSDGVLTVRPASDFEASAFHIIRD